MRLAPALGSSIFDLCIILGRLAGEGIVEPLGNTTFRVPRLDGAALSAMLDWHQHLALVAISQAQNPIAVGRQ